MFNVWWAGVTAGSNNFGDSLTPHILDFFDIKYNVVKDYSEANLISVGSIARRAMPQTTVLGSGIIDSNVKLNAEANWKFVRGPYTRQRILDLGGECPEIYGDPGLLLPLMIDPSIQDLEVGIVPHVVDYKLIKDQFPYEFVINLNTADYKDVVSNITRCKKIISSSLHGIICAHAYGIPAAWVKSQGDLKGDDIKFKDYFESVGIFNYPQSTYEFPEYIEPGKIDLEPIIDIFHELSDLEK